MKAALRTSGGCNIAQARERHRARRGTDPSVFLINMVDERIKATRALPKWDDESIVENVTPHKPPKVRIPPQSRESAA